MATKIQTSLRKEAVTCYALTFGYMLDVDDEVIEETKLGILMDATDLNEAELRELKLPETNLLVDAIKKETYPELYDEDGNLKKFDTNDEEDSKKKV